MITTDNLLKRKISFHFGYLYIAMRWAPRADPSIKSYENLLKSFSFKKVHLPSPKGAPGRGVGLFRGKNRQFAVNPKEGVSFGACLPWSAPGIPTRKHRRAPRPHKVIRDPKKASKLSPLFFFPLCQNEFFIEKITIACERIYLRMT